MIFLYDIPAVLLLLVVLALFVTLAGVGQIYVHRRFRSRDFIAHNEVGGILIAVSGTLYAVVLGFLTVVVWQHYNAARDLVVQESDAAIDAWHVSVGLPSATRERVRNDMVAYAKVMIGSEWPRSRRLRAIPSIPSAVDGYARVARLSYRRSTIPTGCEAR